MNRLFIGTFLSNAELELVDELVLANKHLAEEHNGFRFVDKEKWHLTWMFLGNCSDHLQEDVLSKLEKMSNQYAPTKISYDQFAIWPNERHPRVGVLPATSPSDQFVSSVQQLRKSLNPVSVKLGEQYDHFKPHITIARFKAKAFSASQFDTSLLPISQSVCEVALIRSDLKSYQVIKSFPLKGVDH